jgi:hypothetical protein
VLDYFDSLVRYEDGDLDTAGTLELFAFLVREGHAWRLQGAYGRMAHALILDGLISPEGGITDHGRETIARGY